jgi:hypothetical protein
MVYARRVDFLVVQYASFFKSGNCVVPYCEAIDALATYRRTSEALGATPYFATGRAPIDKQLPGKGAEFDRTTVIAEERLDDGPI